MTTTKTAVPERVRMWLLQHPDVPPRQAAKALGLKVHSIWTYRSLLIKRGELKPRYWRPDNEMEQIELAFMDGLIARDVARRFRVSREALLCALRRRGLRASDLRDGYVFTGLGLARLCGLTRNDRYVRWLQQLRDAGLKTRVITRPGRRSTHRSPRHQWFITAEALMNFLDNPASWPLIDPEKITDPDWRWYALQARERRQAS